MRPNHVVGRNSPPYRVLVPARPSGSGLHRAAHRPPTGVPVGGARLALSFSVLVAVPLLALNLRPAVTSVGAVLADIRGGTHMNAILASVVVAAPVWCFAVGGALAYKLRAKWGTSGTVSVALVVLAATLATRVMSGPYLLLGGTVLACLSIAVLGTLLPVITHAAPTKAWALLTGCYVAAMGGGSGIGALITPQISNTSSWQWGVSGWALLAAAAFVAWRVAARRFSEPPVPVGPRPSPFSLRPAGIAWSTTFHFGLTSGFTFTIMGWLPSILLEHSDVAPATVGWMFGVAMALGVPIALLVPKWARAAQTQSGLAVVLCVPNLAAVAGLLLYPQITPWVWAVCLGLGMPAVGLALTLISLRAAPDGDTAAALSSMVQGFGYAIAGVTALAAGLLHGSTASWDWPLIGLLGVLCGQLMTGMHAGLPTTVYSDRRLEAPVRGPRPSPVPRQPARAPVPQMRQPVPAGARPVPYPRSGPISQPIPVAQPISQPISQPLPVIPLSQVNLPPAPQPVRQPVFLPLPTAGPAAPVSHPVPHSLSQPVSQPVSQPISQPLPLPWPRPVPQQSQPLPIPHPMPGPPAPPPVRPPTPPRPGRQWVPQPQPSPEPIYQPSPPPEPTTESMRPPSALDQTPTTESLTPEPVDVGKALAPDTDPAPSSEPSIPEQARAPEQVSEQVVAPVPEANGAAQTPEPEHDHLRYPRQEALFDLPQQEALFEIPLPRQPL